MCKSEVVNAALPLFAAPGQLTRRPPPLTPKRSHVALCAWGRERQDQLERAWWEEKAELSAGPAEQGAGGRFSDAKQEPESGHTSWQVPESAEPADLCAKMAEAWEDPKSRHLSPCAHCIVYSTYQS